MYDCGAAVGRGRPTPPRPCLLAPPAELLGQEVALAPDCVGEATKAAIKGLADGQVLLLENVRCVAGCAAVAAGCAAGDAPGAGVCCVLLLLLSKSVWSSSPTNRSLPRSWHPKEEKNDPAFAKELAAGCDIFVNDAFGTAHRAHASTAGQRRAARGVERWE